MKKKKYLVICKNSTETNKVMKLVYGKHNYISESCNDKNILLYSNFNGSHLTSSRNIDGFISIDFKDWLEILKPKVKIIGYKSPLTFKGWGINKGDLMTVDENGQDGEYMGPNSKFNLPKEMVETWEPVYEISSIVSLKIPNNKGTVEINPGKYVKFVEDDGTKQTVSFMQIKVLLNSITNKIISGFEVEISYVNIGCKKRVPVEFIKQVVDVYENKSKN